MRVFRAADHRSMPWKNGGGTTTEIAVSPPGASMEDFDWRVSMAHVAGDGPFSSFPAIDRTLSILTGEGLDLVFADGETVRLTLASAPYPFAADRAVSGRLVAGPIDDLNVMSRRSSWQHHVWRFAGGIIAAPAPGEVVMLLVTGDGWSLQSAAGTVTLDRHDAALLGEAGRLAAGDGEAFVIRIGRAG